MCGAGTLLNVITVFVGGLLGLALGNRLPERVRTSVMHGLGLVTLLVGLDNARQTQNVIVVLLSILLGVILGEWLDLETRLERLGQRLQTRFGGGQDDESGGGRFVRGFVIASLVFCVGPLTFLGALDDGLRGDIQKLAIKSTLDGFAAMSFAASLGPGVLFSIVVILLYQGSLTLLAGVAQSVLSEAMIGEMTATGGVLLLGIGLLLLDIKRVRVANFLPALLIAPLIVAVLDALGVNYAPQI